jgi:negative modulator of initiation of replication
LGILSFAYKQKSEAFERVLSLPGGRSRKLFGRSQQEVENSGTSTHPKQIPGTPYWVLTNSDTLHKRDTLMAVLRALDYGSEVVSEAGESL